MLFNSYSFLVYLAVVFPVSRALFDWNVRKTFLLLVSYIFYAAWNPPFVVLLWFSTILDWYLARAIDCATTLPARKRLLALSLLANLGLLGYFKYGEFLLNNFTALVHSIGIPYQPPAMDIILPVGISFYTFQTLSYTFDVYRREMRPWHSFLDYALYVTFFPQLVAGPIVRAKDFLPQCIEPKFGSARQIGWGFSLFVIGLFYKMAIADQLVSGIVENIYDVTDIPDFTIAWVGTLAFALQIYADFSGYSLCAIGLALSLGFALPDNFRFPYGAVGFSDFWRRWHITLSTWLRDYLYIALGGNRKGTLKTYRNLMATMLLGGLWHGASWLFVIRGGLHGLYLIGERLIRQQPWTRHPFWRIPFVQFCIAVFTFILVCFAWVFFRAHDLNRAFTIVGAMLGGAWLARPDPLDVEFGEILLVFGLTGAFLLFEWYMRDKSFESVAARLPWWVRSIILAILLYAVLISFSGQDRAFIYFQF